jgi:hypothetical protein
MTRLLVPLAALGLASACIIYDDDVVYRGGGGDDLVDGDTDATDPTPSETDDTDPADPVTASWLTLDPGGAVLGDVVIASLLSDKSVDTSLYEVSRVEFFGPGVISVLAEQARADDEYLLTLSVDAAGPVGSYDVLVQFQDGTAEFLTDAFEVVADEADLPDAGDGDGGTNGGDGDGGTTGGDGDPTCQPGSTDECP